MYKLFISLALVLSVVAAPCVLATAGFGDCRRQLLDITRPPGHSGSNAFPLCSNGELAILYDPDMMSPYWSAYYRTSSEAKKLIPGRDDFYDCPELQAAGIQQPPMDSGAYKDPMAKGHLAPSHLMSTSSKAKESCYTMCNIASQDGSFNSGAWEKLEDAVVKFLEANKTDLYIVTAVAFENRESPKRIAGVPVPTYYMKFLCAPAFKQSVAFYGRNDASDAEADVKGNPKSVREAEAIFGATIFPTDKCRTETLDKSFWF